MMQEADIMSYIAVHQERAFKMLWFDFRII